MSKKLRILAIYLPQFHPFEENDKWWGKGFTEWRNVVKGRPINSGHYQPHLPKDLGFYDLRLSETREQQAELAKQYGIHGFVYYHYWFNGKRVLHRPLEEVLESKKPDFPFCLCWANENWTRRWDGNDAEVLLEQKYNMDDHLDHINYLCTNIFKDRRYIKVDNKPVFIVYKPFLIPDLDKMARLWNDTAKNYGFKGVYIIAFERAFAPIVYTGTEEMNAFADFSPFQDGRIKVRRSMFDKLMVKLKMPFTNRQKHKFYNYEDFVSLAETRIHEAGKLLYPCVTPMWDNYVRRKKGNANIFFGSTPAVYEKWLSIACEKWQPPSDEENFVFINAWNEWAEGNHLEPCEKWEHAYLEATKRVADKYK